jgi:hypothetical protein
MLREMFFTTSLSNKREVGIAKIATMKCGTVKRNAEHRALEGEK